MDLHPTDIPYQGSPFSKFLNSVARICFKSYSSITFDNESVEEVYYLNVFGFNGKIEVTPENAQVKEIPKFLENFRVKLSCV